MIKIEKTHGSLKKKFDTILHGPKAEAAKTITEIIEELRNPSNSSAQHGYIIQFMREYAVYSFSDIDLLGHLTLCLGSLNSDKLAHITSNGSHDEVIRYTFMNLKYKVIDQISKHPDIVDPLIKGWCIFILLWCSGDMAVFVKFDSLCWHWTPFLWFSGIFFPADYIIQRKNLIIYLIKLRSKKNHPSLLSGSVCYFFVLVDLKELRASTSLFSPKSHKLLTLDEKILHTISPEVEGKRDNVSMLLEASKRAVQLLEKDSSLAEVEQSSILVYLYLLEAKLRSIPQHPVLTQSQKDGDWDKDKFHIFPMELKVNLHNMSALVHQQIVKCLSLSHHWKINPFAIMRIPIMESRWNKFQLQFLIEPMYI